MRDSIRRVRVGRASDGKGLSLRPLARSIALALVGAAGIASADHEGLPFTESFDDAHLMDPAGTTADWGVSSPGQLVLPSAEPLTAPFDTAAPGEVIGTTAYITRALALGDLNGDGWLDLVEGSMGRNGVYLNDGAGSFLPRTDLTRDTGNTRGVAIADFDLDGDLDIVAVNLNTPTRLYLNSGNGVDFTAYNVSQDPEPARADSVAIADMNGDGWPDVLVGTHEFRNSVIHFHTGNPTEPFGPNGVPGMPIDTNGLHTQVVLAGDVDNDGDMDVVLINEIGPNVYFLNDGAGNLGAPIDIGAEIDNSQTDALGDLNGDGFLDLVVGNYMPGLVSRIYFNSGDPAAPFSSATVPVDLTVANDPSYTHHVTLGDVDNDGDLDIVLSTAGLEAPQPNVTRFTNRLYLNDGTGVFAPAGDIGSDMDVTNVIVIGDVDRDGRLDVIAGNEERDAASVAQPQMNRLYRNVGQPSGGAPVRQLSAYATSLPVDTESGPIASVALDASFAVPSLHNEAEFWASSNGGVSWAHVAPGAGQVVFPQESVGSELVWRVVLRSKSPAAAELLALDEVTLTADAPSFTSEPPRTATVGAAYAYDVTAIDPNGDALTLTASTLPAWLTFVDNGDGTGSLTGTPGDEHVGEHEVVLDVADANALTDQQRFTITVAAAGAPPAFTSTPPPSAGVGTEYRYDVVASDPDGDAVTIAASVLPAWLTLTDNLDGTATLVGTPTAAELGDHDVVLDVTDATGLTAQQAFTISVTESAPPEFSSVPVESAAVGVAYEYAITASDPQGDALTITAPTLPDWLELTDNGDGTAVLAGTPSAEHVGEHAVELLATDETGAVAAQAYAITVVDESAPPPDENQAPSFSSSPVASATAGSEYSYAIEAADPDEGDTLTITAPTVPAWLSLTDNGDGTATLSGTPGEDDVGSHEVVLQVSDAAGAVAEQAFTIDVAAATSPPPSSNPNQPPPPPSSSGGGGAAGWLELLGAALGVLVLRLRRRGPRG